MIKSGENQEAAIDLSTVIILSFYLRRLRKNVERVDCQDSLPAPIPRPFRVKDIVPQYAPK